MKRYKLDVFRHGLITDESRKQQRARTIQASIFPLLKFLEKHGIDPATVNSKTEIINKHFKDKFPFPNAPEERNFELLGIDASSLANAHFLKDLNTDFFIDENNRVQIRQEWHDANLENHTSYTATEEENKAYEYVTELIQMIVKGYEDGFLDSGSFYQMRINIGLAYYDADKKVIDYRSGAIKDAGLRHREKTAKKELVN